MAKPRAMLHQNFASPSSASMAPGTRRTKPLSTASMIAIETVSDANPIPLGWRNPKPARKTGCNVSAYPKTNARTIARAICTAFPQPNAVATAIPTTSPITHPVRQWTVAEKAARSRLCSARACKTLDGLEQLAALLRGFFRIARRQRVGDAVIDVVVEELEGQALERRVDRRDLREDVDAVAV